MIEKRPFGKSGHGSTRILFGGAALFTSPQEEADRVLELLLEYGINHIDTAHSYGDSEIRIGPWMAEHRDKFFLATKTEERSYDGAMRELDQSLERLKTDHIDHWQMHVLVDEQGWRTAMGKDGALEAFIKAKEEGIVSNLGVTGHGIQAADFHLRSLGIYPFDSVLLPWNYPMSRDAEYAASFRKLYNLCLEQRIAFQTIKSLCRRPWPEDVRRTYHTWYEPLSSQQDIDLTVAFILSDPNMFLNSTGDVTLLPKILDAAARFSSGELTYPGEPAMEELERERGMEPLFC